MHLQIHSDDFGLTENMHEHITRQLGYALNHGRDLISRIVVRLSDVDDSRGSIDKRCAIEIRLKGASTIAIDDTQADLQSAINRATERVGRTLNRRIARNQDFASASSTLSEAAKLAP